MDLQRSPVDIQRSPMDLQSFRASPTTIAPGCTNLLSTMTYIIPILANRCLGLLLVQMQTGSSCMQLLFHSQDRIARDWGRSHPALWGE
eukprot:142750-Amorphochlora_amoeboformis.AAC.1